MKIYEAEAIQFSFNSAGWYILGGLLLLFALWLIISSLKKYRKNAYRRQALKELRTISENSGQEHSSSLLNNVLALLKMVAMKAFGRERVASLHGEEWLEYLESTGTNTAFMEYKGTILNTVYQGTSVSKDETESLMSLAKRWIKTHA